MSLLVRYVVQCDSCGKLAESEEGYWLEDSTAALRVAKRRRFIQIKRCSIRSARYQTHYCPQCATEREAQ